MTDMTLTMYSCVSLPLQVVVARIVEVDSIKEARKAGTKLRKKKESTEKESKESKFVASVMECENLKVELAPCAFVQLFDDAADEICEEGDVDTIMQYLNGTLDSKAEEIALVIKKLDEEDLVAAKQQAFGK